MKMSEKYRSQTKRKLLRVVAVCVIILLALVLSRYSGGKSDKLETTDSRIEYLSSLGYDIVTGSEEFHSVELPEEFDDVLLKYNDLQLEQGFDLSQFAGKTADQYTYELASYKDCSESVLLTIYIYDGKLIAGDVHCTSLDGFMEALQGVK